MEVIKFFPKNLSYPMFELDSDDIAIVFLVRELFLLPENKHKFQHKFLCYQLVVLEHEWGISIDNFQGKVLNSIYPYHSLEGYFCSLQPRILPPGSFFPKKTSVSMRLNWIKRLLKYNGIN